MNLHNKISIEIFKNLQNTKIYQKRGFQMKKNKEDTEDEIEESEDEDAEDDLNSDSEDADW